MIPALRLLVASLCGFAAWMVFAGMLYIQWFSVEHAMLWAIVPGVGLAAFMAFALHNGCRDGCTKAHLN